MVAATLKDPNIYVKPLSAEEAHLLEKRQVSVIKLGEHRNLTRD